MKQYMNKHINLTSLRAFVHDTMRKPWTESAKLACIVKYINTHDGDALPAITCNMVTNEKSSTGIICSACKCEIETDSAYCRHCGAKVLHSPKNRFMTLIDQMPPHEGKTFEEALADWLIQNGATLPKEEK